MSRVSREIADWLIVVGTSTVVVVHQALYGIGLHKVQETVQMYR